MRVDRKNVGYFRFYCWAWIAIGIAAALSGVGIVVTRAQGPSSATWGYTFIGLGLLRAALSVYQLRSIRKL